MRNYRLLREDEVDCDSTIKPVVGYEDRYFVSASGRVFGRKKKHELKPYVTKTGYLRVKLYNENGFKSVLVHRIVADAFLEKSENKTQVNHLDGDKGNNKVSNLEWVTQSENQSHAYKTGLNTTEYAVDKNKKKVVQKSLDGAVVKTWDSMSEASRNTGVKLPNISHCCNGRIHSAGGFLWSYKEGER